MWRRKNKYATAAPIAVTSTAWQEQFDELWRLLVPQGGAAASQQGEAIRLAGKLSREILDNGAINWDADFCAMADHLAQLLTGGRPVADQSELNTLRDTVRSGGGGRAELYRVAELAVSWVLANPIPVPAAPAPYRN
ncbi:hypothetical protein [Mycobacterium ahvazicum]|uniref:hypothetical protein n=1 Tax=Mycobacterium ahvazicum TaxID=1964395 RepID=UPI000BB7B962|nr:hypothetical protein [Mycobacterium ahvazicum]